ncbi:MAG: hypothetical protein CL685_03520 [Candidatus Magasanikbacteria bacterium]|nr:hypothetical protein [Candidatus Magasanikbacteria bacterium]
MLGTFFFLLSLFSGVAVAANPTRVGFAMLGVATISLWITGGDLPVLILATLWGAFALLVGIILLIDGWVTKKGY